MTTREYFGDWLDIITEKELDRMLPIIQKEYRKDKCYPAYTDIFKVFNLTKYKDVIVVVIGMSPYVDGTATGIPFGTNNKIHPELRIIEEAVIDYTNPNCIHKQFDYTLESWCKQGVLLLNSALTTRANMPSSHIKIWFDFISGFVNRLDSNKHNLIWVLLGNEARKFLPDITYGTVYTDYHPSYYVRHKYKMNNSLFNTIQVEAKLIHNKTINFYKQLNNEYLS